MINNRHITSSKILESITGVILFAIATAMLVGPLGIRADSGEAYIMIAFLLILGSWSLFESLFK